MNKNPNPFDPAVSEQHARLFLDLQGALDGLERYLRCRGYPEQVARDAVDFARDRWIDAILAGVAAGVPAPARRAWLRIVSGRAAATLCRRAPTVSLSADESLVPPSPETWPEPHDQLLLLDAIESLPPDLRLAVTLVDLDGKSEREAAEQLRTSRRRVGRLRQRARRAMKTILSRDS